MQSHLRVLSRTGILGLAVVTLALTGSGCNGSGSAADGLGLALQTAQKILADNPGKDIAVAAVRDDGHVFPQRLVVRDGVHFALWIADGKSLEIVFKQGSAKPFEITCVGPVCFSRSAAQSGGAALVAEYQLKITPRSGEPITVDPRLEVVP